MTTLIHVSVERCNKRVLTFDVIIPSNFLISPRVSAYFREVGFSSIDVLMDLDGGYIWNRNVYAIYIDYIILCLHTMQQHPRTKPLLTNYLIQLQHVVKKIHNQLRIS